MISEDELRKEYTARILDLEEEAHGPLAADEAMLSMMMGEGYRDPNYPKQIADPEFSDVAEIFNQWALSPPPKKYPGKISGRVLSSEEMDLPLFNRLPNKEALGLSWLISPSKEFGISSGAGSRAGHIINPLGTYHPSKDTLDYRKGSWGGEEKLQDTIKHEFTHRVFEQSGYRKAAAKRVSEYAPKDNFWRGVRHSRSLFPLNQTLAFAYAHKLGGGSLKDEDLMSRIAQSVLRLPDYNLRRGWGSAKNIEGEFVPVSGKERTKAANDMMRLVPLLVEDFEKYLQEEEVDRPTQLSRGKYPPWLYGDRSPIAKWLRRSGWFNIDPDRMDEIENELD